MNLKNNKKTIIILVSCVLVLGLVSTYIAKPKEIRVQSNIALLNNLEELSSEADLIVQGSTDKEFSSFKPTITYSVVGSMEDFYTVTDVKIQKVYKGKYDKKYIPVSQVAVLKDGVLKTDTIIDEHYSIMEKNKKYVLFLKKVENENFYSIIAVYQGKYNVDSLDSNEDKISGEFGTYKKMKKEVKDKYK